MIFTIIHGIFFFTAVSDIDKEAKCLLYTYDL